ncbi:hypothetical protein PoB_001091700 [Plakobranchus ocellatus]|uniref:Beta-defensin n=1 Tax=Plakobranchus ocellatus TaxID=259542 RepID=A0AAV3YQJ9_9GAST|nr:hypothetical protein PoB_001091700 [Plakobranchus ocellatus]
MAALVHFSGFKQKNSNQSAYATITWNRLSTNLSESLIFHVRCNLGQISRRPVCTGSCEEQVSPCLRAQVCCFSQHPQQISARYGTSRRSPVNIAGNIYTVSAA